MKPLFGKKKRRGKAKWKGWWLIGGASLAALLLIARCNQEPEQETAPAEQAARVEVVTLALQPILDRLLVTGSLAARHELPISAELGGLRITAVHVEEGDRVKQGQSLAALDTSLLEAELAQREAVVAQRLAGQREAEAYLQRVRPLAGTGAVSAQELESREVAALKAAADAKAAQAQVMETRTKLRQARVLAPKAGVIGQRSAEIGQVSGVGGEPLFRLIENGDIELYAQVPEADLAALAVGQTAWVWVGADRAQGAEGKVRLIRPLIDTQTRLGLVRIALPQTLPPALRPGAFGRAEVSLGERQALTVPLSALNYEDGRPVLSVVNAEHKVVRRTVTLGAQQNEQAEILEGAQAGERIVTRGATFLRDGDSVQPVDAASLPAGAP